MTVICKKSRKLVKHGGMCLYSQHSGGWSRRLEDLKPAWATKRVQWPCLFSMYTAADVIPGAELGRKGEKRGRGQGERVNGSRHRAVHTRTSWEGRGTAAARSQATLNLTITRRWGRDQRRFSEASPVDTFSLHLWLPALWENEFPLVRNTVGGTVLCQC